MSTEKNVHFLCLEPRETDKSEIVLKFSKNLVLKSHFLLLGALVLCTSVRFLLSVQQFQ